MGHKGGPLTEVNSAELALACPISFSVELSLDLFQC